MRQVCALRRFKLFEGTDLDAVLLRESHRRRGRFAVRLERGGDRRPCDQLFEIRLMIGQLRHAHR